MIAPAAALQFSDSGDFVYVVGDGDTVSRRAVTSGPADGNGGVAITQGLEPGERVITRGIDRLTEGVKVIPVDAATDANDSASG
ncbi:hypothetical protein [Halotalea alkalilenta]|uniref:hypothetical protein n=1 Tax=Halotalea alkalilenta TaxID=376489 RepID=UPI001CBEA8C9|nr:hypothetical protein [Halotalea alkalilenta]